MYPGTSSLPPNQTIPLLCCQAATTCPPQRNLEAAISSPSSGLIHLFSRASCSPPSVGNSAVCFPPPLCLQPGPSILIVTTWQHVSRTNSLSQPASPQPNLSQPVLGTNSHQLPPRIVQRPPPRADKTPVFQPVLLFRTKGPPSSCTRAIENTRHPQPIALCSLELAQGVCRGTPTSVLRFWPTAPGRPSPPSLSKG